MKFFASLTTVCCTLFSFSALAATTRYVDLNCTNPVVPYTSWATAATNIQDAINHATFGDTVLVTNGIYQYGGDLFGASNRVDTINSVNLQSVNGPAVTTILGYQVPGTTNGLNAVRCVYLREFSTLSGFTVTNGATRSSQSGGGVSMESSCVVSNCVITGNAADATGAGVYSANNSLIVNCIITENSLTYGGGEGGGVAGCTLNNCVVSGNNATHGGGIYNCTANNCLFTGNGNTNLTDGGAADFATLNNCTVVGNFSRNLGAAETCTLNNSIIYYNTNGLYADCYQCKLTNCCTTIGTGNGNLPNNSISNAPLFGDLANGNYRLQIVSPCINAGTNVAVPSGTDLDGNPRIVNGIVDMGAYENQNTNLVHYVMLAATNPVAPFTNWITAATNIQDAIDASGAGDLIIVSNGIYNVGGRAIYGTQTNRVALTKAVTVQSVNGAAATTIVGFIGATGPVGIRCAYLTNGAALNGFTLTNGSAGGGPGNFFRDESGGGVWCEDASSIVSNCVIAGNTVIEYGGGAFQGTLFNCVITNNSSFFGGGACSNTLFNCTLTRNKSAFQNLNYGGGAYGCVMSNCLITGNQSLGGGGNGGGAAFSTLTGCVVSNNVAGSSGGGLYFGVANYSLISSNRSGSSGGGAFSNTLVNCVLKNNLASGNGGGAYNSILLNCTVVSNALNATIGQIFGGGVAGGAVTNSIVYDNAGGNIFNTKLVAYTCSIPRVGDIGDITNPPVFADEASGNFHLQTNSPCINAGNNSCVTNTTDFDGNPRIAGGTVDIGAYEFQSPSSTVSYAYLQQYGLPTDGSADNLDSDGDGFSNAQEWRAGTDPTNASSMLKMSAVAPTNDFSSTTITWQSVSGVNYFVQRGSDLNAHPVFTTIQSNIVGHTGTTSFTDTTVTNSASYFYRIGVQ